MIHKILVEIETEEGITFEEVLKDIETQFFAEGEIFDVKGTDAVFCSIGELTLNKERCIMDDRERAFKAGFDEGHLTGNSRDSLAGFPIPDFDGSLAENQRGREIGAALKQSEDKNK